MRNIKKLLLIYTVLGVLFIQQPSYAGFSFKFPKFFKSKKEKKIDKTQQQENYEQEITTDENPTDGSETFVDSTSQNIEQNEQDAVYIRQVEIFGNNIIETSFIKDMLSAK